MQNNGHQYCAHTKLTRIYIYIQYLVQIACVLGKVPIDSIVCHFHHFVKLKVMDLNLCLSYLRLSRPVD